MGEAKNIYFTFLNDGTDKVSLSVLVLRLDLSWPSQNAS